MWEQVNDQGQVEWVVEGLGMRFHHHQQWQAEVYLHYLQRSVGLSTDECQPPA